MIYRIVLWISLIFTPIVISGNAISADETSSQIVYKAILDLEKSVWPETLRGWRRDQSNEPKHFEGTPKPEEERAGVVAFNRNWCLYTYIRSVPRGSERNTPFAIKVTPGESEPMSVSLYCLEDLEYVKAKIGDAETISSSAWTTYTVISAPMPWKRDWTFGGARGEKIYDIVPIHLLELPEGIPGKKDQCLQFIFDLKCPEKAQAGVYQGTFEIITSKGHLKVPFSVEVLPFKLVNMDRIWQRGWFEGAAVKDADMQLFRKFGFNSIAFWWFNCYPMFGPNATKDGKMTLAVPGRESRMMGPQMELLKRNGYNSWVWFMMDQGFGSAVKGWWGVPGYPSDQYKEKYTETVRTLIDLLKENGYPVPYFVVNDEPTNRRAGYNTQRIFDEMKWISEMPDVRNYAVMFQENDIREFDGKPYLHMWVSNNPSPERFLAAKKNGCVMGTYRGGHVQRKIADIRFHFGWKSLWFDAPLTFTWGNHWDYGAGNELRKQLNDFLGGGQGAYHTMSFPTPAGPSITYALLAHREAMHDRAYAETLRAKKGDGALKDLKEKILGKFKPEGPYAYKKVPGWADPWTYGQTIQHQDDDQPIFLNEWRQYVIDQLIYH